MSDPQHDPETNAFYYDMDAFDPPEPPAKPSRWGEKEQEELRELEEALAPIKKRMNELFLEEGYLEDDLRIKLEDWDAHVLSGKHSEAENKTKHDRFQKEVEDIETKLAEKMKEYDRIRQEHDSSFRRLNTLYSQQPCPPFKKVTLADAESEDVFKVAQQSIEELARTHKKEENKYHYFDDNGKAKLMLHGLKYGDLVAIWDEGSKRFSFKEFRHVFVGQGCTGPIMDWDPVTLIFSDWEGPDYGNYFRYTYRKKDKIPHQKYKGTPDSWKQSMKLLRQNETGLIYHNLISQRWGALLAKRIKVSVTQPEQKFVDEHFTEPLTPFQLHWEETSFVKPFLLKEQKFTVKRKGKDDRAGKFTGFTSDSVVVEYGDETTEVWHGSNYDQFLITTQCETLGGETVEVTAPLSYFAWESADGNSVNVSPLPFRAIWNPSPSDATTTTTKRKSSSAAPQHLSSNPTSPPAAFSPSDTGYGVAVSVASSGVKSAADLPPRSEGALDHKHKRDEA